MNLIKTKKLLVILLISLSFISSCTKYSFKVTSVVYDDISGKEKFSITNGDTSNTILSYKFNNAKIKKYIKDFKTYKYNEEIADIYSEAILYACIKYDIDIDIMLSLIKYESSFNSLIVHKRTGCIGATQINPTIWTKQLIAEGIIKERKDLFSLRNNILSGAYVLNHYMKKTNNIEHALQKYYGTCNYASIYSNNVLGG
ncbi:MAG: transglycosylase SLT domain-containing protein [Candidatus Delongbacteria bacterium]|nr:transglycosylase SLT domain-containing protein [Candidatus Delongbacteria bacterium]